MVYKALPLVLLALSVACGAPATGPVPAAPGPVAISDQEVRALGAILQEEDQRSVEPSAILEQAASPSPVVRRAAAVAIGRLEHRSGVPVLVALLSDADTAVAAAAAFSLGQVGDTAAVEALAGLLSSDTDPRRMTVADEAAYALGKLPSRDSRSALRQFLQAAPLRPGPAAMVARSALLAIWRFPRDAEQEPVPRWLTSIDPEVRWRATYALVRRPDPRATPLLPDLLADRDERVRALAARGLTGPLADSSGIGAAAARGFLLQALDDPSYLVRINAIGALGTHRHTDAVHALIGRLESDHPHESYAATEAIGRLGDTAAGAASALEARVADELAPVALRRAALDALVRLDPVAGRRSARAVAASPLWRLRAGAAAALAATPTPEYERLLRDPDGRVAAAALQGRVEQLTDSLIVLRPLLIEALRADDVGVRTTALRALRRLADPSTLPALLDAYDRAAREPANDAAPAAIEAIAALQGRGHDPSRAFFVRFSRPADPLLHQLAVARFGDPAISAWGDPHPIHTGRDAADYEEVVRQWVVPAFDGTGNPLMVIETSAGTITLRLLAADAPLTVESFSQLAGQGYFDGQEWPRVVPNFVVQGGDPGGDMSGGPGYTLRDEISRHRYRTGTLGMALSGPDTGGSQFFITHSPQPHLDGIYAVFGEVVDGLDVTKLILPGDAIRLIRVVEGSRGVGRR